MYSMIIVDDEPSTRLGLSECVDWSRYGIRVAGEADDGGRGWELFEALQPDIVVTDVKMPGMDGIELARRIASSGRKTHLIFVSGYDDVDYLKSALKTDAADYILKPIDLAELEDVIGKVVDRAEKDRTVQRQMQEMENKLLMSIPLLREKFWTRLIRGTERSANELSKQMSFLGLDFPIGGDCCAVIIRIDDQAVVLKDMPERDIELCSFAVQNICLELLGPGLAGCVLEYNRGEFVAVVSLRSEEDRDTLYALLKTVKKQLCAFLGRFAEISLTIGLGEVVSPLTELHESYRMASEAASLKLFLGKNHIITVDQLGNGGSPGHRRLSELAAQTGPVLKAGDADKVSQYAGELFAELSRCRSVRLKSCQTICLETLLSASKLLIDLNLQDEALEREERELRATLFELETLQDMQARIEAYLLRACRLVARMKLQKSSRLIETVKRLIHERYSTNLTIKEIAAEVYLTSTYICLLFKQETGETINEYLTRVRMEKAKELLEIAGTKLYDICFAIGYAEPGYFSKQFKKYCGLSPSEYRERALASLRSGLDGR
ncbi:response regulator [Paenibacillus humicola]|uniref:response regulator n=1 Tax=Paenibacillus humicola TaxID=3110540 RepID=UPI00237AF4D8|nr:response regulator [Paenibacillus humicola]